MKYYILFGLLVVFFSCSDEATEKQEILELHSIDNSNFVQAIPYYPKGTSFKKVGESLEINYPGDYGFYYKLNSNNANSQSQTRHNELPQTVSVMCICRQVFGDEDGCIIEIWGSGGGQTAECESSTHCSDCVKIALYGNSKGLKQDNIESAYIKHTGSKFEHSQYQLLESLDGFDDIEWVKDIDFEKIDLDELSTLLQIKNDDSASEIFNIPMLYNGEKFIFSAKQSQIETIPYSFIITGGGNITCDCTNDKGGKCVVNKVEHENGTSKTECKTDVKDRCEKPCKATY